MYFAIMKCNNVFIKCNPYFLTLPVKPPSDLAQQIMEKNNFKTKSLRRMKSKAFIQQETDLANSNSIKLITNQLHAFHKEKTIRSKHQYGQSSLTLLKENIEKRLETSCIGFIKNRDTIYAPLLCIVILTMLIGSIFITLWWKTHGHDQISSAMFLATEAVSERVKNRIIDQFFVPQMLISLTIGALYDGDITINNITNINNSKFFAQFPNCQF